MILDKETILAITLKKYRQDNGLTQAELAEQLDVSDKTISKWENG
ncbi:helix-turn-helix transcriptional regulator, partial [Streptococcus pluranimalium]|nr:helix-turn-helix transcriptional regulator [Streptococcus pluranimalium]